jgi:uncharacterized protein (DUF1330 family)
MSAYVVAEVEVTDAERYSGYTKLTPATVARHGGRFIVRGGSTETLEGAPPPRIVVIEFPDVAAARRWYLSPDYAEARRIREGAAKMRLFIVDGAAG